jgi:hypothetical protein
LAVDCPAQIATRVETPRSKLNHFAGRDHNTIGWYAITRHAVRRKVPIKIVQANVPASATNQHNLIPLDAFAVGEDVINGNPCLIFR